MRDTDPRADTTVAARAPGPSSPSSTASSRPAPRSPSPASAGTADSSSRICGSNASTADGRGLRSNTGGTSERNARAHRVARHAQPTNDLLDRQALGPMQPTDLGPILHVDHPPSSWPRSSQGSSSNTISGGPDRKGVRCGPSIRGQFSAVADNQPTPRRRSAAGPPHTHSAPTHPPPPPRARSASATASPIAA